MRPVRRTCTWAPGPTCGLPRPRRVGHVRQQAGEPAHRVVGAELDDAAIGGAEPGGHHAQQPERDPGCVGERWRGSRPARTTRHMTGSSATTVATRSIGASAERGQLADEVAGPPQAEDGLGAGGRGRRDLDLAPGDQDDEAAGVTGDEQRLALAVVPGRARLDQRRPVGGRQAGRGRCPGSTCRPARRQCARSSLRQAGFSPPRDPAWAASTSADRADHSGRRPVAELAVGEHDAGHRGVGVDPQERARPAEVPERAGRPVGRGPVRGLGALELEPEAPGVGVVAAEAGHHPGQPGELLGDRLGERLGCDERRCAAARVRSAARSSTVDQASLATDPRSSVRPMPSGPQHRLGEVVGGGHAGGGRQLVAEERRSRVLE